MLWALWIMQVFIRLTSRLTSYHSHFLIKMPGKIEYMCYEASLITRNLVKKILQCLKSFNFASSSTSLTQRRVPGDGTTFLSAAWMGFMSWLLLLQGHWGTCTMHQLVPFCFLPVRWWISIHRHLPRLLSDSGVEDAFFWTPTVLQFLFF